MKILLLSHKEHDPKSGASKRLEPILRVLKKHAQVDVVYLNRKVNPVGQAGVENLPGWKLLLATIFQLAKLYLSGTHAKNLINKHGLAGDLKKDEEYDLIWFFKMQSYYLFRSMYEGKTVIDFDDWDFEKTKGRVNDYSGLRKVLTIIQYKREKKMAITAMSASNAAVVCSELQKTTLPSPKLFVIPNVIDLSSYEVLDFKETAPSTLIHIGNYANDANVKGMEWFHNEVWSELNGKHQKLRLHVLGKNAQLLKHLESPGVELIGEYDELQDALNDIRPISIAPIHFGSGTRIKILESLASGIPVISTTKGAEGLGLQDGKHLLIADQAVDFQKATSRLIEDNDLYNSLREQGLKIVNEQYSAHSISKEIEHLLTF